MTTYVALFRGINVGGRHALSMKDLKRLLENIGCAGVRTYIQSGNAVFTRAAADASRTAQELTAAIAAAHGFEPRVLILTREELDTAASGNPFPDAVENPNTLHLFFLAERPKRPDTAALQALKTRTERFILKDKIFYLHAPDGFGTSKLAERAERLLGVTATARNWRTVRALLEMTRAVQD